MKKYYHKESEFNVKSKELLSTGYILKLLHYPTEPLLFERKEFLYFTKKKYIYI